MQHEACCGTVAEASCWPLSFLPAALTLKMRLYVDYR